MPTDDLALTTIRELGRRLRRRQVSVEEVVRATIARTETWEPKLNSYITFAPDRALEAARVADRELRQGHDRGPLHGVPISIKDHIATAGIRTTAGAKLLRNEVPDTDAIVVRRLQEAGAIVMGKANMNRYAGGESGWNPDFGKIRNPRSTDGSAGGSSGGSAAQVAAGLAWLSVGSDNGGSIRIPAALCGVVGLKPTVGRVSMDGIAPRTFTTDHTGPITRTVADAALALAAMAGHVPGSTTTARRPVPDYTAALAGGVRGVHVGVDREFSTVGHPRVLEAFAKALDALQRLGATFRDVGIPPAREYRAVTDVVSFPEVGLWLADTAARHRAEATPFDLMAEKGLLAVSAADYLRAGQRRRELQAEYARATRDVDVLVAPAYFLHRRPFAPSSDAMIGGYGTVDGYAAKDDDALHYTLPFNVLGVPALTVPCELADDGGAVGLQIVGRPFEEAAVLQVAHAYELSRAGAS